MKSRSECAGFLETVAWCTAERGNRGRPTHSRPSRVRNLIDRPASDPAAGAPTAHEDHRLVDAARTQDGEQVRALLARRADANFRSGDGSMALLWAAHWNDADTAERLVRAGADANAANDLGMTPLGQACTNGSAALVTLLLGAGATPNTTVATGETLLMT